MSKMGPVYRFKAQRFWAENGLVCIEDQISGSFKALTRAEAAARAVALNAELPYMQYPSERDELCNCVVNLCEAVKEAKRQGDPTDPNVRRQLVKDQRKVSMLIEGHNPIPPVSSGTIINDGHLVGAVKDSRFYKLEI